MYEHSLLITGSGVRPWCYLVLALTYVIGHMGLLNLYYKRVDTYLCSALTPVLEGSGSRRLYTRKGTSVDRVSVVFVARVYLGFFTIRQKRIRGGSTYAECNSGSLKERRLQL